MTGDSWWCGRPEAGALSKLPPSHPIVEAGTEPWAKLPGGWKHLCCLVAGSNEFLLGHCSTGPI